MAVDDSVRARAAGEVRSWDLEADVVIVGYGGAGAGAAIEAASAGADTLVLERAGAGGGSSALSGGYVYTGGGTALQKACGFTDTADNMYAFLMAATGPNPNAEKVRVYCDEGVAYYDWLVSLGVPFKEAFYDQPTWQIAGEYGLGYSGGENAHPWNRIADAAPRAHVAYKPGFATSANGEAGPGSVVMDHLFAAAGKLGVRQEHDIRVLRLVEEADGRIIGVEARRYGTDVTVRARRGVVLAAGGFMANEEMLTRYAPALLGTHVVGTDGDDGRAIRMAQAVGAAVQLMDRGECAFMVDAQLLVRCMIVNRLGQRFINEDTYPGRIGQAILTRQDREAYAIFDAETEETVNALPLMHPVRPDWVCDSLAELEEASGIAEGGLQSSVAYYSTYAEQGRDPMFHKNPKWLKPFTGPYGATRIGPETMASFTLGGLVTPPSGEVLDLDGKPIPGLYAAGRTASGIPASGYLSGSSLGDSIFFGRKAGASAARPTQ